MTPTRPLPLSPSRNPNRNPNRRLESRQSFRLTKLLTRNNDIDRRIKSGKEYALTVLTLTPTLTSRAARSTP